MTYLDEWRSGTFLLYSCKVAQKHRQDCLMSSAQSFYGLYLRSVVYSLVVLQVTQFYQVFPHISTASDKRWREKAWVRG